MRQGKGPVLTVDALIEDEKGRILLIQRGVTPFKGEWCLPGGKVDEGERVEAALEREVIEELGTRIGVLELFGVYSEPDRDPRGHFVSIVFHATVIGGAPKTTDEAVDLRWITHKDDLPEMGFDHAQIVKDWWNHKGVADPVERPEDRVQPRMRKHPVDPIVVQGHDESEDGERIVEDEAARGKRKRQDAEPMKGSGTKNTAPAGKAKS